jgi:hypothetical protein
VRSTSSFLFGGVLLATLTGCGEQEVKQVAPTPPDPLADVPEDVVPELDEGHWAFDQRAIPLDTEDFAVLQTSEGAAGVSIEVLRSGFKFLVLNLPYLDYLRGGAGTNECVDVEDAADALPLGNAQAFLDRLESQEALTFDAIIVNVDLMNPQRVDLASPKVPALYHVCGNEPFFGDPGHRASILQAFTELASLPKLAYVTVGTELNKYTFYQTPEPDRRLVPEDYVNLATLYREIYAAVKGVAPAVKVGPGFSWDFMMNVSVPSVAAEFGITDPLSLAAFYRTWQRTIYPFLVAEGTPNAFPDALAADFVGLTILPDTEADPFLGDPAPTSEEAVAEVEGYYRHVARMGALELGGAGPLPVAFTQIDWPVKSSGFRNQKAPFLETFKRSVSHADVAFAAWRRMSDVLTELDGQTPPCDRLMEGYGQTKEFCNGGLTNDTGSNRDAFEIFLTDP